MTQEEALNILKSGRNVYLTGAAGSGKTYVLNAYIKYLRDRGVFPAITASTGIAATHIGGQTIHSWSGMGIKEDLSPYDIDLLMQKEHLYKRYERTQVLIIDEVSMLAPRMFDALDRLARMMRQNDQPFGGMQIVLSGDFFQLPPIVKGDNTPGFIDSTDAWRNMDIRTCYLETQFRQDDQTLESVLSEIRGGAVSEATQVMFEDMVGIRNVDVGQPTKLFTHNADVDSLNDRELDSLDGDEEVFEMSAMGKANLVAGLVKSILAPKQLRLKENAVVMFVKNNFEEGYVNGTLGTVVEFDGGQPIVETFGGKRILVTHTKWEVEDDGKVIASVEQLPLRLAWAITVHKSQGMSLDAAEIDLSKSFVPGQGYVALSRLRKLDGLVLLGLNKMAFAVDPYVLELDRYLRKDSLKWSKVIAKFDDDAWKNMHEDFIERIGGTNDPEEIKKNQEWEPEQIKKKIPTHEQTLTLVLEGKSVKDIAKERGMTTGTIISHLEKLQSGPYSVQLDHYKPKAGDLKKIQVAFVESGGTKLAPVHKSLKGKYTYEELRLARIFI